MPQGTWWKLCRDLWGVGELPWARAWSWAQSLGGGGAALGGFCPSVLDCGQPPPLERGAEAQGVVTLQEPPPLFRTASCCVSCCRSLKGSIQKGDGGQRASQLHTLDTLTPDPQLVLHAPLSPSLEHPAVSVTGVPTLPGQSLLLSLHPLTSDEKSSPKENPLARRTTLIGS